MRRSTIIRGIQIKMEIPVLTFHTIQNCNTVECEGSNSPGAKSFDSWFSAMLVSSKDVCKSHLVQISGSNGTIPHVVTEIDVVTIVDSRQWIPATFIKIHITEVRQN